MLGLVGSLAFGGCIWTAACVGWGWPLPPRLSHLHPHGICGALQPVGTMRCRFFFLANFLRRPRILYHQYYEHRRSFQLRLGWGLGETTLQSQAPPPRRQTALNGTQPLPMTRQKDRAKEKTLPAGKNEVVPRMWDATRCCGFLSVVTIVIDKYNIHMT